MENKKNTSKIERLNADDRELFKYATCFWFAVMFWDNREGFRRLAYNNFPTYRFWVDTKSDKGDN